VGLDTMISPLSGNLQLALKIKEWVLEIKTGLLI